MELENLVAFQTMLAVWFVLLCVVWVLEVGFLLDRWMWWRRSRAFCPDPACAKGCDHVDCRDR